MFYYIVYSSITFATGIKNKFRYDSERIDVLNTPSAISKASCSYCIRTKSKNKAFEIIKASKDYGVNILGFYKQTGENDYEEITY